MNTDIFDFLSRYFWAVGLVLALVNTAIKWIQLRPRIQASPELAPGYVILLRGLWLMLTVPWIPMGIGIMWGNVPTVSERFATPLQHRRQDIVETGTHTVGGRSLKPL